MIKPVRRGEKIPVSVKLEFDGTVYNKVVLIEDQFITLSNDKADEPIILDGDPIMVIARFRAEPGSKVKTFEITINGYTLQNNDLKIKTGEFEIKQHVPFSFFDLVEITQPIIAHEEGN